MCVHFSFVATVCLLTELPFFNPFPLQLLPLGSLGSPILLSVLRLLSARTEQGVQSVLCSSCPSLSVFHA